MRALLVALMLTVATQAGAQVIKLSCEAVDPANYQKEPVYLYYLDLDNKKVKHPNSEFGWVEISDVSSDYIGCEINLIGEDDNRIKAFSLLRRSDLILITGVIAKSSFEPDIFNVPALNGVSSYEYKCTRGI